MRCRRVGALVAGILGLVAASGPSAAKQAMQGTLENYLYLRGDGSGDETVLAWTTKGDLWVSQDQGSNWSVAPNVKNALDVTDNPSDRKQAWVMTDDRRLYVTRDRGRTFVEVKLPAPAKPLLSLTVATVHPKDPNRVIVHGTSDCASLFDCPITAYASEDGGKSWTPLLSNVRRCLWVDDLLQSTPDGLIMCEELTERSVRLVSSVDKGASWKQQFDKVYGVALNSPYLIAAVESSTDQGVDAEISVNGETWAQALLPPDLIFNKDAGYTVISTNTKSSILFATTNNKAGHEFGALLKSNYNGTQFVTSSENVNRDVIGFVDYDRVSSTEGVALANIVANPEDVRAGARKKLQTRITHSDGAMWDYVRAPKGKCPGETPSELCALHLHGHSERFDPRQSPSSPTAVGLIIAQGNVGDQLTDMRDSSTFMSRDGGISWTEVGQGPAVWEFGDSGSIIVLVDSDDMTDTVRYTLDEGATWNDFKFSEEMVRVVKLATIPSDTSRKFVLFAQPPASAGDITWTIQLDFSGLTSRKCGKSDFEKWTPVHPQTGDPCLFGHKARYLRKKTDRDCYVGKSLDSNGELSGEPTEILKNCSCKEDDYECDYNFVRGLDGKCQPIAGTRPLGKEAQCATGAVSWHVITGYRRTSLTTCVGGLRLDAPEEFPCPGHEDDFVPPPPPPEIGKPHRGRFRLFLSLMAVMLFIIVLLLGVIIVVSRFTQLGGAGGIRLGDAGSAQGPPLEAAMHIGMDVAENIMDLAKRGWEFVSSQLLRRRTDRLGFYSRMDDEERYRILESDFEEDASDAASVRDEDAPDNTLLDDDILDRELSS